MVLLIDNYDSFTYNLYQYLRILKEETVVLRNDEVVAAKIEEMNPGLIALSPGPGKPEAAGNCIQIIKHFAGKIPIFGICLGMQAIGEAFGCEIRRAIEPVHGKVRTVLHESSGLFEGCPSPLKVTRYHSLVVDEERFPDCLRVTGRSEKGEVMALEHRELPIFGVQFHPEAYLTECGMRIMENALSKSKELPC